PASPGQLASLERLEIGRASCWERVEISVVAVSLKKNQSLQPPAMVLSHCYAEPAPPYARPQGTIVAGRSLKAAPRAGRTVWASGGPCSHSSARTWAIPDAGPGGRGAAGRDLGARSCLREIGCRGPPRNSWNCARARH